MYRTFFYILLLVLVVAVHSGFLWHQERTRQNRQPWSRGTKAFLAALAVLCAAAVAAGFVIVAARLDSTASHAMGGLALLLAVWFDFRLGRACGK